MSDFTTPNTKLASGVFKFSSRISARTLVEFIMDNWINDPNFIDLHVRGCDGDRKFGIGFKLRHSGDKLEYQDLLDRYIGRLTRRFSSDLAGWDLCSSTYPVKG